MYVMYTVSQCVINSLHAICTQLNFATCTFASQQKQKFQVRSQVKRQDQAIYVAIHRECAI